jgi:hypothetical protein
MKHTVLRSFLFTLCACACLSAVAEGEGSTLRGQETPLFGGTLSSYAKLDAQGRVVEAGIIVPLAALEAAPLDHAGHAGGMTEFKADAVVDFPSEVQTATYLNHLGLFWNPAGHEPLGRYGVPHWDFHFFTLPSDEAAAIDCSDPDQGDLTLVSEGWTAPEPFCVPLMGFHSLPATEFAASGELQEGFFEKVMIGGHYGGEFIFIEPMLTQELLLQRQDFSLPVPRPKELGRRTLYPGSFDARYDAATDSYALVFSDFTEIE